MVEERITIEKAVCYSLQGKGATPHHTGPSVLGGTRVGQEPEGRPRLESSLWSLREGMGEARSTELGLTT